MFELLRVPVRSEFRSVFPRSKRDRPLIRLFHLAYSGWRVSRKSRVASSPDPITLGRLSIPLDRVYDERSVRWQRSVANKIERERSARVTVNRNQAVYYYYYYYWLLLQRKIGKCMWCMFAWPFAARSCCRRSR